MEKSYKDFRGKAGVEKMMFPKIKRITTKDVDSTGKVNWCDVDKEHQSRAVWARALAHFIFCKYGTFDSKTYGWINDLRVELLREASIDEGKK